MIALPAQNWGSWGARVRVGLCSRDFLKQKETLRQVQVTQGIGSANPHHQRSPQSLPDLSEIKEGERKDLHLRLEN